MKVKIQTGDLELPEDFSFEIEKTSSVFSEQGEQSVPVTVPATPHNLAMLGQPLRPARHMRYPYRVKASLEAGAFIKTGELIVSKYSRNGISASFVFSESVIYSGYKETTLKELFKDTVRTDFRTPWEWAGYLIDVYNGSETDEDFTVFPVLTEKNEDSYLVLNEPDTAAEPGHESLIYSARLINVGGEDEKVPEGYGLTPFLYLRRAVSMMFGLMGYAIGENAFDDSFFDKVVLVNNNADSICDGTLHYADLMPSCTVAEWLEWMEAKFGIYLSVRSDGRTVDLVSLKDIYERTPDMGISELVYGEEPEISVTEPSHLVISSGTSIDGAAPAAETWAELVERYGACIRMEDTDFLKWESLLPSTLRTGTLIYRLSHGEFYETQTDSDGNLTLRRAGTDYFARDGRSTDNAEERTASDELPPLYDWMYGSDVGDRVNALYIGSRLHSRTSVIGKSGESDGQKIIIAADTGMSALSYGHNLRYRFGTIRGLNNQGNLAAGSDLRPEALYTHFFTGADYVARNCTASVKLTPHLSVMSLLSYDMLRPKWRKGALLLPKSLNYTVGRRHECGSCDFQLLQQYADEIHDTEPPVLPDIHYYWKYVETDAEEIKTEWLDSLIVGDSHSYTQNETFKWENTARNDFLWMQYPDRIGQTAMRHFRILLASCKVVTEIQNPDGSVAVISRDASARLQVPCWYESAPFDM